MKSLLLLTLFCLCSFQKTRAQGTSEDVPVHTLTFKTLALSKGEFAGIYVQAKPEENPVLLSFNRYSRSSAIEYEGPSPIVFFKIEKTQNPEIPFLKVPVATFQLPPEGTPKELLLIFRPNKPASPRDPSFLVFGMNDSRNAFPPNSVIIFNATPLSFIGLVNQKRGAFPPGPSKPFPLDHPLTVAIAQQTESSIRVLFKNTFQFQKDTRVLLMIHPPKRQGSLRIQCYHVTENMNQPQKTKEE